MLPPEPPRLFHAPSVNGRVLNLGRARLRIEQLGMWPSAEGLYPNLDMLCRLSISDGSWVHSVMVEVDRLFLYLPDSSSAIVRSLERKLQNQHFPLFAYLDATEGAQPAR